MLNQIIPPKKINFQKIVTSQKITGATNVLVSSGLNVHSSLAITESAC